MADKKISQLTNITGADVVDSTDELAIVDASSNETKAITRQELFKSVGAATFDGNVSLGDDNELRFGDSNDLKIEHRDTGISLIDNSTGTLFIRNLDDDQDILIQSDNGSGGTTNYFAASGSTGESKMYYYGSPKITAVSNGVHVSGGITTNDEVVAEVVSYASNQNAPYMIAATTNYTGATTNVGTYGLQHRFKFDSGGSSRITVDGIIGGVETELWALYGGTGNMDISGDLATDGSATLGTTSAVTGGTADGLNVVGASNGLLAKFGGNRTVYDRALQLNEFVAGATNNAGFQFNAEGASGNAEMRFAIAGTDVVTISDSNFVGIGLTDPGAELHIMGSTPQVRLQPTGDTQNSRIEFCNAAGTIQSRIMSGGVNGDLIQLDGDVEVEGALDVTGSASIVSADPYIKLTDTNTGVDHEIDANSGVGNLVISTDINSEGSDPKLLLKVSGTTGITVRDTGDVDIAGALSKGSGSFKIDHPLKPETHHLVHSFVEAPQADNIYRGKVALSGGSATVNLDEAGRMTEGTFVALNGNIQCFTTNEDGWTAIRGSVSGNALTIEAQDATCTDTVSWLVIGERHDQHMIDTDWTDAAGRVITEPEKQTEEEE